MPAQQRWGCGFFVARLRRDQLSGAVINLLSRKEVCERLGVTYVTVWNWMRKGQFPRGIIVSDGVVRWPEHEVEEWLQSRPRQRLKGDEADEA